MSQTSDSDFGDVVGSVSLTAPGEAAAPRGAAPQAAPLPARTLRDLADMETRAEPLGRHAFSVLSPRLLVVRYRGVVDELDIRALAARIRALESATARVVVTDASELTRFGAASRRALSEEPFHSPPGSELLLAAAGASPERQATLTVVLSVLKLTTNALVEGFHVPDLSTCLLRARQWLDARPQ